MEHHDTLAALSSSTRDESQRDIAVPMPPCSSLPHSVEGGGEDRDMLRKLVAWKRRLNEEDSPLRSLQGLEEICVPSTLFSAQDSVTRRSLLLVTNKLLRLAWQNTNFGRQPLPSNFQQYILKLYWIVDDCIDRIQFDGEDTWLGGTISKGQTSQHSSPSSNSSQFLSICIHLIALLIGSKPCDTLSLLLYRAGRFVVSCARLSMVLMENDERCLSSAVALLYLHYSHLQMPSQFDVATLFCSILHQISFDHSVIIDWLTSELAAVPFILRFIKDITLNVERYQRAAIKVNGMNFSKEDDSTSLHFDSPSKMTEEDGISLRIVQLHGEQQVTSEYTFSTRGKAYRVIDTEKCLTTKEVCSLDKIMECFMHLRESCQRLQRSHLQPFNLKPIIVVIDRLYSVVNSE